MALARSTTRSLAELDREDRRALVLSLAPERSRMRGVGCFVELLIVINGIPLTEMMFRDNPTLGMLVGAPLLLFALGDGLVTIFGTSWLAARKTAKLFVVDRKELRALQKAASRHEFPNDHARQAIADLIDADDPTGERGHLWAVLNERYPPAG